MSFDWANDYNDSVISMEDITDRVEELREVRELFELDFEETMSTHGNTPTEEAVEEAWKTSEDSAEAAKELAVLEKLVGELRGYGGDHQWEGDWYPASLISESYFTDYARELAHDIYGTELRDAKWPFSHINWEDAADTLRQDYSSIDMETPEEGEEVASFLYR